MLSIEEPLATVAPDRSMRVALDKSVPFNAARIVSSISPVTVSEPIVVPPNSETAAVRAPDKSL